MGSKGLRDLLASFKSATTVVGVGSLASVLAELGIALALRAIPEKIAPKYQYSKLKQKKSQVSALIPHGLETYGSSSRNSRHRTDYHCCCERHC